MDSFTARPAELGTPHEIALKTATLRYFETGDPDGPVVVFVHGLLVNAGLWRKVVPGLAAQGLRCLAVDWPLGAHQVPAPEADLSPYGVADLIHEFLVALDLHEVTVVANDTGGALTQLLMTRNPERIGRVVLTPADSFERFFPPLFSYLPTLARVPGSLLLLAQTLRPTWVQRIPVVFGWLSKRAIDPATADSYLRPSRTSRAIRKDLARFLTQVHRRYTLAAAEQLPAFDKPALLAWAVEDKHFPISLAHRLLEVLPDARLVEIEDCYTFVPEDRPDVLVELIAEFVGVGDVAQSG